MPKACLRPLQGGGRGNSAESGRGGGGGGGGRPAPRAAARKAAAAAAVAPEPPPGSPGGAAIRVRLPDGASFQRRFLASDPLQARPLAPWHCAAPLYMERYGSMCARFRRTQACCKRLFQPARAA